MIFLKILFFPIGFVLIILLTIIKSIFLVLNSLANIISGILIIMAALFVIMIVVEKQITLMHILTILFTAGMGLGLSFISNAILILLEFLISQTRFMIFRNN